MTTFGKKEPLRPNQFRKLFHGNCRPAAIALAAALFAFHPLSSTAGTWTADPATPADWFDPANWTGGIPSAMIAAEINNGGTAQISAGSANASSLYLGSSPAGSGSITLSDGTLTISQYGQNAANELIGVYGTGIFLQSGGTHNVGQDIRFSIGYFAGSVGNYTLTDGQLNVPSWEYIGAAYGGTGTFTQSGGINNSSVLYIGVGGIGNYFLSGGQLINGGISELIGWTNNGIGTFTQTGGSNTASILIDLGSQVGCTGTYSLSGTGVLSTGYVNVGGSNTSSGGTGHLHICGGSATITTTLKICDSLSDVELSCGSLTTSNLIIVGGSFSQTGGTFTCTTVNNSGTLHLDAPATISTVTLNAGTLSGYGSISGSVLAGSAAHTIAPSATLSPTSTGTLTMGSLTTSSLTILSLNLVSPGTNDALNITSSNGLTLNGGQIQITNAPNTPASLGYYKIIQYSGNIQGTGLTSLTPPTSEDSGNVVYSLSTTHDPGFIDLHRGYLGDLDDSGFVDINDLAVLAANWQQPGGWSQGNFLNDPIVDINDLSVLASHWQTGITSFGAAADSLGGTSESFQDAVNSIVFGGVSAVPEPTSLALLGLGAAALLARRRNHNH